MLTNFCEQLATTLQEIEVPVFIENLAYWIRKNHANEKHFHEGRYWSYNSYPAFAKLYPFWSEQTIRRIIKRAVAAGLLLIGNFNKKKYDNTNWYTLTDKALQYYPALHGLILNTPVENDSTPVENDRPIPKQLPSSSNNTITTSTRSSKSKSMELMLIMITAYREIFPDNPQPHARLISTKLQKILQTLIKRWPEADPEGNALDEKAFRRYLTLLKQTAPKFTLGEYVTINGNKRKNGMDTFCRWDTLVQFLENKYS